MSSSRLTLASPQANLIVCVPAFAGAADALNRCLGLALSSTWLLFCAALPAAELRARPAGFKALTPAPGECEAVGATMPLLMGTRAGTLAQLRMLFGLAPWGANQKAEAVLVAGTAAGGGYGTC